MTCQPDALQVQLRTALHAAHIVQMLWCAALLNLHNNTVYVLAMLPAASACQRPLSSLQGLRCRS